MRQSIFRAPLSGFACVLLSLLPQMASAELRVGAAKVDITPQQLPVLVNGSMQSRSVDQITTRIHARAIVVADQDESIAMVVVDSCILPRYLLDEAKALAASKTSLRPDCIMISATHTHSAPSSYGALGTDPDATYVPFLRQQLASVLVAAESKLQPAKVGWGSALAPEFTALRRWVLRPDKVRNDPFGNPTVRATMHAARNPSDAIGPTGPEDSELSLIAFQTLDDRPIAVLANFSMHYFGSQAGISADYFGAFCDGLEATLRPAAKKEPANQTEVVAILSHGCSGDIWRRDYMSPQTRASDSLENYTSDLLEVAKAAYQGIEFEEQADVAMEQAELQLKYRVPDQQRLAWAKDVVESLDGRLPKTQPEIYAREQVYLDQRQTTSIVLQAIRIGDIAIATTPCETYALTGLKLKLQSPLERTMVIELANGGEGYIPPPEQHLLGGYNTWAARSAGLEVQAEPRIVAKDLQLLEQVAGKRRRRIQPSPNAFSDWLTVAKPTAYWPLQEFAGPFAHDAIGNHDAVYEPGVLYFLEGPSPSGSPRPLQPEVENRCVHFAGGRLHAELDSNGTSFTFSAMIWNGMPTQVREITGWFFSRDHIGTVSNQGIHLGLDGEGHCCLQANGQKVSGRSVLSRWSWAHVIMRVSDSRIVVYLDGADSPEIELKLGGTSEFGISTFFFGGRSDNESNWEGRMDEICLFDRELLDSEVASAFSKARQAFEFSNEAEQE